MAETAAQPAAGAPGRKTVLWVAGGSVLLGLLVLLASTFEVDAARARESDRRAIYAWLAEAAPEGWDAGLTAEAEERGFDVEDLRGGGALLIRTGEERCFRAAIDAMRSEPVWDVRNIPCPLEE